MTDTAVDSRRAALGLRYGTAEADRAVLAEEFVRNEVLATQLARRSVRKFLPDNVSEEQLRAIVAAASSAASRTDGTSSARASSSRRCSGWSMRNATAGVSASATSVLNLAVESPGLYRAVGVYSGCPSTSDPVSRRFVEMVVEDRGPRTEDRGRGDVTNMWGPVGDPAWVAHDPYLNAERLRGTELHISSGTVLPGYDDTLDGREIAGDPLALVRQAGTGGVIEAATGECTRRFVARPDELGIPAHVGLRPTGTHSWTYRQDDLHRSWPVFDRVLR